MDRAGVLARPVAGSASGRFECCPGVFRLERRAVTILGRCGGACQSPNAARAVPMDRNIRLGQLSVVTVVKSYFA
ncbi:MAG: hypothetical protein ACOX6T_26165 [Myxococcales bacterium]|jgi:hypothetical protein